MPLTDQQLDAQRRENAALREELKSVHAALSTQSLKLQNVKHLADDAVEATKSARIADIAQSHDVVLKSCELTFSQKLADLTSSMKVKKSELGKEDEQRRKGQLATKDQIEADYKQRIEALKRTLSHKEQEVQQSFQAVTHARKAEIDRATEDCKRLEAAETVLIQKIEKFAGKQQEIDLVHQRAQFETQIKELRSDYRARIAKFEEQTEELLSAKQLFYEERLTAFRVQEQEKEEAKAAFVKFGNEALAAQEKVYEADLARQEAFLKELLDRDVRSRVELERMNAEEARKLGMREDKEAWTAQIARMKAEMP